MNDALTYWLWVIGLLGGAVVGLGATWQKGILPLYRHLKNLNASVLAAAEVIKAQLPVEGGATLLELVGNIDRRSSTAEEHMVRLDREVAKLRVEVSEVPSLVRSVVKEELAEQWKKSTSETAAIAARLAGEGKGP